MSREDKRGERRERRSQGGGASFSLHVVSTALYIFVPLLACASSLPLMSLIVHSLSTICMHRRFGQTRIAAGGSGRACRMATGIEGCQDIVTLSNSSTQFQIYLVTLCKPLGASSDPAGKLQSLSRWCVLENDELLYSHAQTHTRRHTREISAREICGSGLGC